MEEKLDTLTKETVPDLESRIKQKNLDIENQNSNYVFCNVKDWGY